MLQDNVLLPINLQLMRKVNTFLSVLFQDTFHDVISTATNHRPVSRIV